MGGRGRRGEGGRKAKERKARKKQKGKEESPAQTHQTTQPAQCATVLSVLPHSMQYGPVRPQCNTDQFARCNPTTVTLCNGGKCSCLDGAPVQATGCRRCCDLRMVAHGVDGRGGGKEEGKQREKQGRNRKEKKKAPHNPTKPHNQPNVQLC